jgi:hypothetical protein
MTAPHSAEQLAKALGGAKRVGRGWKARCPAHDDHEPSLSINQGNNGAILVKCHAGCLQDAVIRALRTRDLWPDGEKPDPGRRLASRRPSGLRQEPAPTVSEEAWDPIVPPPNDAPKPDLTHCVAFEYVGCDGRLLFYQRRFERAGGRKSFAQLTYGMLDGKSGWHKKGPKRPYPLYRLDRLTIADPDTTVIVVEGEKACHAAERLFPTCVVTTWLNGANSVANSDWSPLRRFKRVIWWPDADKPRNNGKPAACEIATSDFRKLFPLALLIDTSGLAELKDGFDAADLESVGCDDPDAWLATRVRQQQPSISVWDPWEDPPPPEWPGGILPRQIEDTLAAVSLRDGVDFGVLCMTVIAAASAAAPHDARFSPYMSGHWTVPPIIWCMLIGKSGLRKTLLDAVAFAPIRARQSQAWSSFRRELEAWRRADQSERGDKPEEPHSFIVNDYTSEALQLILGRTPRGTAVVKDELAGFFDFSRYGGAPNHGNRAFFLSAYDDQPCPVHRIGRDSHYLEHTGVSVFGAIQPDKLATLTGLESDGLLQRFLLIRVRQTDVSRRIPVEGLDRIHQAIDRLCSLEGKSYRSTSEGEETIRTMEVEAKRLAMITDYGVGWEGFCHKAHGTHARLALVLHLLENPDVATIPAETVQRAARLTRFLFQHARDFYSLIPDGRVDLLRDIAGWLLTKKPDGDGTCERIVANQVASGVRGCRPLGSKGIAEVLDPFITGGWLEPESDFPGNRAWAFNPGIRTIFAAREIEERERRRLIREAIRGLGERVT